MNKKLISTLLSLFIIAMFLMSACTTATPSATSTSTQNVTVQATEVAVTDLSNVNTPPSGGPAAPPPGVGMGSSNVDAGLATATGAYTLDGGAATLSGETYTATNEDQSGVFATNSANLTLSDATIITSGNTSSDENSSFYGLNAGVLAAYGSTIDLSNSSITTNGTGANGVFATGDGSIVNLTNVTINATGDGAHGIMATQGGVATLTDVSFTTSGAHSAPVATDRGGGTITTTGDTITTSGTDSPCYYSTGSITATNAICTAIGSESVVIEGSNSVALMNSTLTSSIDNKWGVMIYQSFSGDAQGTNGTFIMNGGSLSNTASNGPLFYVTNSTGNITLTDVKVSAASGILVEAAANDRWGTSGSNGGNVVLTADKQVLVGNMIADKLSTILATLQNGSSLKGAINSDNTAQSITLTLDATSTWDVTADTYLSCLSTATIDGSTINNITGNGHTVYYDASVCSALGGKTYSLNGGGTLTPAK